jgi:hypothetical protein
VGARLRGTNQTGELNGLGQGLMWLGNVLMDEAEAAFVYDTLREHVGIQPNAGEMKSEGKHGGGKT